MKGNYSIHMITLYIMHVKIEETIAHLIINES